MALLRLADCLQRAKSTRHYVGLPWDNPDSDVTSCVAVRCHSRIRTCPRMEGALHEALVITK